VPALFVRGFAAGVAEFELRQQTVQLSAFPSAAIAGIVQAAVPRAFSTTARAFNDIIGIDLGTTNSCVAIMEVRLRTAKRWAGAIPRPGKVARRQAAEIWHPHTRSPPASSRVR
jgi:hypothetical protein